MTFLGWWESRMCTCWTCTCASCNCARSHSVFSVYPSDCSSWGLVNFLPNTLQVSSPACMSCVSTRGRCQYSWSGKLWGFSKLWCFTLPSHLAVLPVGLSGVFLEEGCCKTEGSSCPSSRHWVSPKHCHFCQHATMRFCIEWFGLGGTLRVS